MQFLVLKHFSKLDGSKIKFDHLHEFSAPVQTPATNKLRMERLEINK